ncbi:hypothetical protein QE152_g7897 [Popillia japonica]|uniref:Uncharacterized protein n=1 Tax=Popillia japonica TaxID=7064 RepID=A0AAW1MDQ3_POPJA
MEKIRAEKLQNKDAIPQNLMTTAILTYNQSVQSTTGYGPFSLLYGPYKYVNAHELHLDMVMYDKYNEKRKNEPLPFYDQLYHKQLNKGSRNKKELDANKEQNMKINEPTVYVSKQRIRKPDPRFDKINVTTIDENKTSGIRENSNKNTNIHIRKVKRIKKTFNLQDGPHQPKPGPSGRVHTVGNEITKSIEHNHVAEMAKCEAQEACNRMKEVAQQLELSIQGVIAEVPRGLSLAATAQLPLS